MVTQFGNQSSVSDDVNEFEEETNSEEELRADTGCGEYRYAGLSNIGIVDGER